MPVCSLVFFHHSEPSQGATTLVLLGTDNARQEEESPRTSITCRDMCLLGTSNCSCLLLRGLSLLVDEARSCLRGKLGEFSLCNRHSNKSIKL